MASPYILVRRSKIHGTGVFARKAIPAGTRIIEYVGEKVTKAESESRYNLAWKKSKMSNKTSRVYLFTLNKRYDIDGDVPYNTARFINHSCDPNCDSDIIRGHVWIIARREIQRGEEISYNYGYDFDSHQEHPCHCRSKRCVGFILAEEHWPKLKRWLAKQKKIRV